MRLSATIIWDLTNNFNQQYAGSNIFGIADFGTQIVFSVTGRNNIYYYCFLKHMNYFVSDRQDPIFHEITPQILRNFRENCSLVVAVSAVAPHGAASTPPTDRHGRRGGIH
jgi:hypothetical protein